MFNKEVEMLQYIILGKFTDEGVKNIKEFPKQLEAAEQKLKAAGIKVTRYFTQGKYDIVVFVEAPSDEAMARVAMAISSQGHVRLQTMRAFTQAEFLKMI
jgi:uncharacterized protein with GYD domain